MRCRVPASRGLWQLLRWQVSYVEIEVKEGVRVRVSIRAVLSGDGLFLLVRVDGKVVLHERVTAEDATARSSCSSAFASVFRLLAPKRCAAPEPPLRGSPSKERKGGASAALDQRGIADDWGRAASGCPSSGLQPLLGRTRHKAFDRVLTTERFTCHEGGVGLDRCSWRARLGSNQQPLPSEGSTLSIELRTQQPRILAVLQRSSPEGDGPQI